MPSNHLILCCLLLLPANFPGIRVFSNELALCIWCPVDWSFSTSLSNECSGLISFKIDWLDIHLCQHHSLKASILQLSAFFMIQLSHLYVTTGKTIALTRWIFVGKLMSTCISSSVQSLSHVWLFVIPWTAAHQASLSITNSQFTQTHCHWVNDAIQPSHPLSSPSPLTFNLSQHQGLFKWVSSSHQVAKVLEFQH